MDRLVYEWYGLTDEEMEIVEAMGETASALNGYNAIAIHSPLELVNDEREEGV